MTTETAGLFSVEDVPSAHGRAWRRLAATEPALTLPAVVSRSDASRHITVAAAEAELRAAIASSGALTVDVETTGYPVGHAHFAVRTVQLGDAQTAIVFDPADPAQARVVGTLLAQAPTLHAHSATADLVPLASIGLIDAESAWARMHDTVIPAKLADPASTGSDPGLKQLASAVLGDTAVSPGAEAARAALFARGGWLTDTEITTPLSRSGWAQVDPTWRTMVHYAAADVLDTAALATRLPAPSPCVLERERAVQRITARVTHTGLRLDGYRVAALLEEHTTARAHAARTVRAYGVDNPGSSADVSAALLAAGATLPRTANGAPSVALSALHHLAGTDPVVGALVAAVLEYRHHDTLISTFLEPYHQLITHGNGRVYPTVYTLGTTTGRMSCVRPNLQQLPRTGGVRGCITADPGHLLISADFSGVELRVAAALSGDDNLCQMIQDGVDIHWRIARQVFGSQATKADRYAVKRGVFGRLYGGGIPTLARQVGCSEAVAAEMVTTLDAMTPQLATWSARLRDRVKSGDTRFTTYSGAIVHLPREYPHKAPNYVIQRTARELLVDSLLRWQHTAWGGGVLLPIHDEIVASAPDTDAGVATEALVACMHTELHGVPIVAEPDAPRYAWADAA